MDVPKVVSLDRYYSIRSTSNRHRKSLAVADYNILDGALSSPEMNGMGCLLQYNIIKHVIIMHSSFKISKINSSSLRPSK